MSEERIRQIVRQFPENGLKQVLSSPGNVRDLLALAKAGMLARISFEGMQIDPTTYVTAEYRHVSSDLVLCVTLLPSRKGERKKRLTLTILIELQSQPDRLMLLRLLEYLVQIWKSQVKQYGEKHKSLSSVKLQPVLPVVLHTGSYSWETMGTLLALMDDAEDFRDFTPDFKPLFISLPDKSEADLETEGGYFGQVLALIRAKTARRAAFAQRLEQTVTKLQELKGPERLRRLELLCYVEAFVYHSRESSEHTDLRERIDAALSEDETRLEINMVRRTLADVHREEGYLEGERKGEQKGALSENKKMLVEQLRLRFTTLSPAIPQVIETTQDIDQIREWMRLVITARDLDSIGILPPR